MVIQISHVDLSNLPVFPHRIRAAAEIHAATDAYYALRMQLGASLAPPAIRSLNQQGTSFNSQRW